MSCTKYRHATFGAALAHCKSMEGKPNAHKLRPYRCGLCGGYHIGNCGRRKPLATKGGKEQ